MTQPPPHAESGPLIGIADGLDVLVLSADEILVQFGTRSRPSELFRDVDLKGVVGPVISRLLQGPAYRQELLDDWPPEDQAEIQGLIDDLLERGILADVQQSPVEQYIRYTFTGESALAQAHLSLLGAGPLGAQLAQSLSQHGVGHITLLDDRTVDRLWSEAGHAIGLNPREAAGQTASRILSERLQAAGYSRVEALDAALDETGVQQAVQRATLTIVAFEQPVPRLTHLVNRLCINERKPWLLATIDGNFGLVGPLFVPVHTACYNDYLTLADAATPRSEMARMYRKHLLTRHAGSFFTGLPAYAQIVAGHASLAAIHYLLRGTSFALGRVLVFDFDRMSIDVEDVLKLPRCPVCGSERSSYRPAFVPG